MRFNGFKTQLKLAQEIFLSLRVLALLRELASIRFNNLESSFFRFVPPFFFLSLDTRRRRRRCRRHDREEHSRLNHGKTSM